MEVEEGRRITRQATKNPEKPAVPQKSKRKRVESSSSSVKPSQSRRRRSRKANNIGEDEAGGGNVELKQSSWSSGFSISDDEELPSAELCSPSKNDETKTYKKFDIAWIKYKQDPYRPCLITGIYKSHVCYRVINEDKRIAYRARFQKIIPFDNSDRNYELLNEGRKKCPKIVDAYDRVKHYWCRLSEQKDLNPLKYLFVDKVEDLLYGIIPELQVKVNEGDDKDEVNKDAKDEDDEFERPFLDDKDFEDENGDEDIVDTSSTKNNDEPEGNCIYKNMTDENKAKLTEKIKVLLQIIESEDCFNYLKQIVEESVECSRMKLLKEEREVELSYKSGLGPFFGAERSETDQLLEILENHARKLQYQGDVSLLVRHVFQPEVIIFAVQRYCKLEKDAAEEFFRKWTHEIPEWEEP